MHPSSTISYDLAQARIADLRHQARREGRTARGFRVASTGPSAGTGPPPPPADVNCWLTPATS